MSRRAVPTVLASLAVASLLAATVVLAAAHPVQAADELGAYAVTFTGTAAGRGGGVGASGGLVSFSGGPADVAGRLDGAPSSSAQASSIEPGTMARLVGGQVNDGSGSEVVGEPTTARAEFPGDVDEDDATQADPGAAGPLRVTGGRAHAEATADRATAVAEVAELLVGPDEPAVRIDGAFGDGRARADGSRVSGTVTVGVAHVVVLGELELWDVVGTATVDGTADGATASSELTVGAAAVGGVPVTIGDDGVVVDDDAVLPGSDAATATEQVNAALEAAGIRVRLHDQRAEDGPDRAVADSGGVGITVTTPSAEGIPGNTFALVVGRATTTAFVEPAQTLPAVTPAPADTFSPVDRTADEATALDGGATPRTSTTAPSVAVAPSEEVVTPPDVADDPAPTSSADADLVVAGRRMSARTAYAGFATWLLSTSAVPLLLALWLQRREAT